MENISVLVTLCAQNKLGKKQKKTIEQNYEVINCSQTLLKSPRCSSKIQDSYQELFDI